MPDGNVPAAHHYDSWDVKFSCAFEFPEAPAREAISALAGRDSDLKAEWSDGMLRLSRESGGDLGGLAETLADVMQKHELEEIVTLQAAYSCSDSYPCQSGGLAVAVGAGDFTIEDTGQLARRLAQELRMGKLAVEFESKYPGRLQQMLEEIDARPQAKERDGASQKINVTRAIAPDERTFAAHMGDIFANHAFSNNGEKVRLLEEGLKQFLGVDQLAICANGTLGLEIAIHAAGAAGKQIITTPFTYVATASAALWCGCDVLFADIDEETLCMSPASLEKLVSGSTAAIMPVDIYGHPCDFGKIAELAGKIPVIYDAAQAFGASLNGKSLFDFGDYAVCSLHATKVFHTFEGGFVACRTEADWQKLNLLRAFGHDNDRHYQLGINAKMSEAHAAIGLSLLDGYSKHLDGRMRIARIYDDLLDFGHLRSPKVPDGFESNYGYYPIIFGTEDSLLKTKAKLEAQDIHPRRYFYPSLTLLPYVRRQSCPVAESIAPRVLCLPIYSGLDPQIAARIAETVNSSIRGAN